MTSPTRPPVALIVLDGWGIRAERENNAIAMARTPVYDELMSRYPHAQLIASGEAVGLPAGQMGNSEVGHMNMGAGRVVYQDLTRIDKSIRDVELFQNPALMAAMDRAASGKNALHFIGLLSDGGVHSHQRHLHALIEMAAKRKVPHVFIQAITDGRDTSPTGGVRYVAELEDVLRKAGVGRIATVGGRYYAMDRDKRWERTKLAYDAMLTKSIAPGGTTPTARSAGAAIQQSYDARLSPTSSSSRSSSSTPTANPSVRFAMAIQSFCSTSAPIVRGRSRARWLSATNSSTGFLGQTARAWTQQR